MGQMPIELRVSVVRAPSLHPTFNVRFDVLLFRIQSEMSLITRPILLEAKSNIALIRLDDDYQILIMELTSKMNK